jgi:hypothetical protein
LTLKCENGFQVRKYVVYLENPILNVLVEDAEEEVRN